MKRNFDVSLFLGCCVISIVIAGWIISQEFDYLPNSNYAALWICSVCKGEYTYPIKDRRIGDVVCPYCNDMKVLPGFNSFKVRQEKLMKEWEFKANYLTTYPDHILSNYPKDVWWRCQKCDYTFKMSPKRRIYLHKRRMEACPFCKGRRQKRHYNM